MGSGIYFMVLLLVGFLNSDEKFSINYGATVIGQERTLNLENGK